MSAFGSPLVSVIMPAYNEQERVRWAINSVLQQDSDVPIEIIVVNDGSTDRTAEVISGFKLDCLTYLEQSHGGPAAARNLAISKARGRYLAFLDADDLWLPGKTRCQLAVLNKYREINILVGKLQLFLGDAQSVPEADKNQYREPFSTYAFQPTIFEKSIFDTVGPLNEELMRGEDIDWFMRAKEKGLNIQLHDQVAVMYRLNEQGLTYGKNLLDRNIALVLKRSLDRRREQA